MRELVCRPFGGGRDDGGVLVRPVVDGVARLLLLVAPWWLLCCKLHALAWHTHERYVHTSRVRRVARRKREREWDRGQRMYAHLPSHTHTHTLTESGSWSVSVTGPIFNPRCTPRLSVRVVCVSLLIFFSYAFGAEIQEQNREWRCSLVCLLYTQTNTNPSLL